MGGVKLTTRPLTSASASRTTARARCWDRSWSESEEHVDWLETQLGLIASVGLQNYLTEQMGEADDGEHS